MPEEQLIDGSLCFSAPIGSYILDISSLTAAVHETPEGSRLARSRAERYQSALLASSNGSRHPGEGFVYLQSKISLP